MYLRDAAWVLHVRLFQQGVSEFHSVFSVGGEENTDLCYMGHYILSLEA